MISTTGTENSRQSNPDSVQTHRQSRLRGGVPVVGVCINYFGGQLNLRNPRTTRIYECTRPSGECPFRHQRSNGMTKVDMLAIVGKFPVQPRGYFEKAIAALPGK